jgi:hypothetical protein
MVWEEALALGIVPCYHLAVMSDHQSDNEQHRDKLLLRLLKAPPKPRPTRERDKGKPKASRVRDKRATEAKREPSA